MERPDGISESAWEKAGEAYWVCNPNGERAVSQETIARAIQSAVEAERERIAKLIGTSSVRRDLASLIRKGA